MKAWIMYGNLRRLMRKTKAFMSLSFDAMINRTPFRKLRQRHTQGVPSNIYRHISECPLDAFIDCSVDKKYKSLIKYGTAKRWHLESAWANIYAEFADQSGGSSYKSLITLAKQIGYEEMKLLAISLAVRVLLHRPDEACIKLLRGYGYRYAFDITDDLQYIKDIDSITKKLGGLQLSIEQKRKEMEQKQASVSDKVMTREMFNDMLTEIGKHLGFRLNAREITVAEFVSYKKHYEKTVEYYEKQKQRQPKAPKR